MKNILIVEDDKTTRQLLKTLFELENYKTDVIEKRDIDHIINFIVDNRPDFVMLDVHLKEMDGIQILQRIRNKPVLSNIRILMTSGMDHEIECIENGADGFLLKPYSPIELMQWFKKY